MKTVDVKLKKLSEHAVMPTYGYDGDACFDLAAIEDVMIKPGEIKVMRSGMAFQIPYGYEMQIRPRSGLSFKKGIMIPNSPATIDFQFTGEVKTALINLGKDSVLIKRGDRYAQATIKEVTQAKFEFVDELHKTNRGSNGFGSTGK